MWFPWLLFVSVALKRLITIPILPFKLPCQLLRLFALQSLHRWEKYGVAMMETVCTLHAGPLWKGNINYKTPLVTIHGSMFTNFCSCRPTLVIVLSYTEIFLGLVESEETTVNKILSYIINIWIWPNVTHSSCYCMVILFVTGKAKETILEYIV